MEIVMKIKILKSCSGYRFSFRQGETAEVEDYIGNDLIGCGFAEAVKQKTAKAAEAKQKTMKAEQKTAKAAANAAAKADAKKETAKAAANAAAGAEDADA